jgi:hypothetical protein
MNTSNKRKDEQPDYDTGYSGLEINEPNKWFQVLKHFDGPELAMIAILIIAVHCDKELVEIISVVLIAVIGIASIYRDRDNHGPSIKKSTKGKDEPRRARRGQAKT